ncbi:MAG TPA: DinB family protein [Ktedonobacterales bacterium]|nr:DinB family protein [Ktedonobacterales bacterium]
MTATTPPERYADLLDGADPVLARLVEHLDRALRPRPAPPRVQAALGHLLQQRSEASLGSGHDGGRAPGTLSRRAALKVGAASMGFLLTLGHITPATARELAHLAREGPMTGVRLASILRTERTHLAALLERVGPERMEEPGVEGTWSVKELVAHLTWYERAVVDAARQVLGTGTFTRARPADITMDELNARVASESRARPVADVLAEADRVFAQLLDLIAACPEDLLNDPRRMGLPDDVVPWMLVANNSYAHFRQHEQAIQEWLDRTTA